MDFRQVSSVRDDARRALLFLSAAFATGCSSAGRSDQVTQRDSAGISIVEYAALPAAGAALQVAAEPYAAIGVATGEEAYQFQYVRGATRLSNGQIVVADAGSSQLRYFDESGRHVRSVGRDGDGPGEFRFLAALLRAGGDSVVAVSLNSAHALLLFDPAGQYVRALGQPPQRQPIGLLGDGRALYSSYANKVERTATGHVQDDIVLVARRESSDGDTLLRLPGNQEYRQPFMNGIANGPVPFGRHVEVGVLDNRALVGVGRDGEVRVFENDRLARIIRFGGPREELSAGEVDAWKAWRTSFARNPAQATLAAEFVAAQTFPSTRPVFSAMLPARDGSIWLQRYEWNGSFTGPARWYVVRPDGNTIATVDTPPGLRILEAGADYILGITTDSLGVESVRAHHLIRS